MSRLSQSTSSLLGVIDDVDMSKLTGSGFHVREGISDIGELAATISQKGLLQPLIVRAKADYY